MTYDEPLDANGHMLTLKDRVRFPRRYEKFLYATVYAYDGSFVGLLMQSKTRALRVLYPAGWVEWVAS
jgi:hypothetical protein